MTATSSKEVILAELAASAQAARQDTMQNQLWQWVSPRIGKKVVDLDAMVVTAPSDLKSKYSCYDEMAEDLEMIVQQVWAQVAKNRILAA